MPALIKKGKRPGIDSLLVGVTANNTPTLALGSGVIVAQLPPQYVHVRQEPIRPPTRYFWPFGSTVAPVQPSQPFSIWFRPTRVTIEPEPYTIPVIYGIVVMGIASSSAQSFHFQFYTPPQPRLEAESYGQPTQFSWPWNRFAQPFQPLNIFRLGIAPRLDAAEYLQPAPQSWPFGRVTAQVVTPQSFHFLLNSPPSVRLDAEGYGQPPRAQWQYSIAIQPAQSFSIWATSRRVTIDLEPYAIPPPQSWSFGTTFTIQAWNWWQIQPPCPVPDTSQYYEYRSRDFGADWRLFWITPTTPIIPPDDSSATPGRQERLNLRAQIRAETDEEKRQRRIRQGILQNPAEVAKAERLAQEAHQRDLEAKLSLENAAKLREITATIRKLQANAYRAKREAGRLRDKALALEQARAADQQIVVLLQQINQLEMEQRIAETMIEELDIVFVAVMLAVS